ncbi:MAG: PIG-L family deacetylase [Parachlamydiaceae bacterium]|nr:PIG-L family deacetylase [Parachlamydiaceae bacterium]
MKKKKVLIVEAHSDDSCISLGGFLERFKEDYEYHFFLTAVSSVKLHHAGLVSKEDRIKEYENFISAFNGIWHRNEHVPFNFDSILDRLARRQIVSAIEHVIDEVKPNILICQGPSFHHDHTIVYEATIAATRPTACFIPQEIYVMENPTYVHSIGPSTDFKPDFYCQLTPDQIEQKLERFKICFPSQIRNGKKNYLSIDGIRSLARYRGIEAGCEYAEALRTYIRII